MLGDVGVLDFLLLVRILPVHCRVLHLIRRGRISAGPNRTCSSGGRVAAAYKADMIVAWGTQLAARVVGHTLVEPAVVGSDLTASLQFGAGGHFGSVRPD
jgi:hypothetical protein